MDDFKALVDKASNDGVVSSEELAEMAKPHGGMCMMKCVLVKRGYFTEDGEVTPKGGKSHLSVDMKACIDLKKDNLCETVVARSICIVKLIKQHKV